MRFLRFLVAALAASAPALLALPAHAVSVTPGNPVWSAQRSNSALLLNQINRADCLAPDVTITFDVSIVDGDPNHLFEVWAGTGCSDKAARDENRDCLRVAHGDPKTGTISVRVKDILQPADEGLGEETGTDATCSPTMGGSGTVTRSLFFLVLDPGSLATQGTSGQWDFTYDLVPPAPPTSVTAGPGENSLTLKFTASEADDLDRYRLYCSQEESATAEACSSTVLVAGESAPAGLKDCGSTSATAKTSGQTNDTLSNGLNYAVAVAAEDKLGNVGALSNIACAQPQEVTGYFEAYRAAGGQAGGGFCSFAPARRGALPLSVALALGLVALARRRR